MIAFFTKIEIITIHSSDFIFDTKDPKVSFGTCVKACVFYFRQCLCTWYIDIAQCFFFYISTVSKLRTEL